MAPLKFSRVVSFSSEDPTHPATGLLGKVWWWLLVLLVAVAVVVVPGGVTLSRGLLVHSRCRASGCAGTRGRGRPG